MTISGISKVGYGLPTLRLLSLRKSVLLLRLRAHVHSPSPLPAGIGQLLLRKCNSPCAALNREWRENKKRADIAVSPLDLIIWLPEQDSNLRHMD